MAERPLLHRARRPRRLRGFVAGDQGQAVVEFALILPLMMILLMALIEFALAFHAVLGIQRASTDAVLTASSVGNDSAADCLILQVVENEVTSPNNVAKVNSVRVQRTSPSGTSVYATNTYTRTGSTTCPLDEDTDLTVPYSLTGSAGYPADQRCTIINGCPTMTPARTGVDTVAVNVNYTYTYVTPLGSLMTLVGGDSATYAGWTFGKRNLSRLEPTQ